MAETSEGAGSAAVATNPEGEGSQAAAGEAGTEAQSYTAEQWNEQQWREELPEEYATDPSLGKLKTNKDLAKSYVELRKYVGSEEDNKVRIPTSEDSDDVWMKFYNAQGRPEEASGYELNMPEDFPEDIPIDTLQKKADNFRAWAHEEGLSKKQAETLWNKRQQETMETVRQIQQAESAELERLETASKKEFGDKLPELIKTRNNIIAQYGDDDVAAFINQNKIVNRSPALLKMFDKLGKALGEDKITREVKKRAVTPKEAEAKIRGMMADPEHPINDLKHAGHGLAKEEYNELLRAKDPHVYAGKS